MEPNSHLFVFEGREEVPMKTLIVSAFALCLATAAPTVLLAQDDHHDQSHPDKDHPGGAMTSPSGVHTDTHHDMTVHHDPGTGPGTGTATPHSHHHTATTSHDNMSGKGH